MRLDQLRHFVWLVKVKNFTEAAAQLHISTSALSKNIKSLEDLVGSPLINRDTKPLSLTKVGEEFYNFACETAAEYEYFTDKYRKNRAVNFEQVRLFSMPMSDVLYVSDALAKTVGAFPQVEFINISRSGFPAFSEIIEQDVSVLIVPHFEGATPVYPNVESVDLPNIELRSYCRPGHPILQQEVIAFGDLWQYPVLGPYMPREIEGVVTDYLGRDKFRNRPFLNILYEQLRTIPQMLSVSDSVSLPTSRVMMQPYVESGEVVEIPLLPHPFTEINVKMLIKQEARRSKALTALIANLIDSAQKC